MFVGTDILIHRSTKYIQFDIYWYISKYPTQLAKMSFDEILDLTAADVFHFIIYVDLTADVSQYQVSVRDQLLYSRQTCTGVWEQLLATDTWQADVFQDDDDNKNYLLEWYIQCACLCLFDSFIMLTSQWSQWQGNPAQKRRWAMFQQRKLKQLQQLPIR